MAIQLRLLESTNLPIDVRAVELNVADSTEPIALDSIKSTPVVLGRNHSKLGDLFELTIVDEDFDVVWTGELKNVHGIGFEQSSGRVKVASDCGRHLGSRMSGGTIHVAGDTGDYVGNSMTGGTIWITGDAGDFVGNGFSGEKFGMNGGEILIQGNSGPLVGAGMRRGLIFVGGRVGDGLGESMLAGSIVVCGETGANVGRGMKRGTIILLGDSERSSMLEDLTVRFRFSDQASPPVAHLVGQRLLALGIKHGKTLIEAGKLSHYAGDVHYGGRGEVFVGQRAAK